MDDISMYDTRIFFRSILTLTRLHTIRTHTESYKMEIEALRSALSEANLAKEELEESVEFLKEQLAENQAGDQGESKPQPATESSGGSSEREAELEAKIEHLKSGMVKAREMCRSLSATVQEHEESIEEAEDKIAVSVVLAFLFCEGCVIHGEEERFV